MKYTTDAYLITCLTNLHAGSGDANYGVVDNLVQRDSITEIPIINSSSLKGALREYFAEEWKDSPGKRKLNYVFGPDPKRNQGSELGIGNYKFFDANLIVLPVRSTSKPFFRGTAEFILNELKDKASQLGVKNFDIIPYNATTVGKESPQILSENSSCILEDYVAINALILNTLENHVGDNPALFHEDDFKELAKKLPVIARNQLENGQSKNLWYEEVVPRESRFIFFVSKTKDEDIVTQKEFDDILVDKTIQIGANASIGYGFTKIKRISKSNE